MVNKTKNYDNFLQAFLKAGQNNSFAKSHVHLFRVPTPPGKSWKNILENYAFFIGSNGKQAVYIETM